MQESDGFHAQWAEMASPLKRRGATWPAQQAQKAGSNGSELTVSGQLARARASGWNRERHTASKSMRDVAALHLALPGCASTCAAVFTPGMASAVCGPLLKSQSTPLPTSKFLWLLRAM